VPHKTLTFHPLAPGIIPWTLLGFILVSACIHAFGFYIFQTIYPPVAHLGPPPVQISLLTPGTPETDPILRWIDSEDPALAAQPGKAPIPGLMSLPYIPSYATVHARPVMPAAPVEPLPYPSGASGLELVRLAGSSPTPAPEATVAVATVLRFSDPLKDVVPPLPSFAALPKSDMDDLQTARFLLGVSAQGEVQYVFLQETSGDKRLDAAASRILEQVHFRSLTAPLNWGFASFHWGPAVYAQPAPAATEPAP